ncbi:MAG TPA: toll/interleukin-1 receptor domain-containing protein [Burkholderiales bacterium]|nr:toll/interleukin-1 receptor domain-containing protein [Burkholderiales bacterium]
MKLFLSYPSAQRELADRLALALEAERHEVFVDRTDLKAGEAFHRTLREAILGADGMVFLVTPESVAPGSYALAELDIAQQRWRRPGGRVLPVMVAPTPIAALPPYLSAVTVLQPRGDTVAEVVAAVARLAPSSPGWRRVAMIVAAVAIVAGAAGLLVWQDAERRAVKQARLDAARRNAAEATSASELCDGGGYAVALQQLNDVARHAPGQPEVIRAREDCAMRWLREMRAIPGKQTFGEQVAEAQPVLVPGLAQARGQRAADLRAHIGWGEYLRGRDGTGGVDPVTHWRRALDDDADNVYAHAMWARQMLDRRDRLDEAKPHFAQAVASGRDRAFVRTLQFGAALGGGDLAPYAVTVADEMRRNGESIARAHRDRLWSSAFGPRMLDADARAALFAALPPPDLFTTFLWLFPAGEVSDERRSLWRFSLASLQANSGDRAAARANFEALVRDLRAAGQSGRLLDEARRGLERAR